MSCILLIFEFGCRTYNRYFVVNIDESGFKVAGLLGDGVLTGELGPVVDAPLVAGPGGDHQVVAVSSLASAPSGRKGEGKLHDPRISRCFRGNEVSARLK